jgi:hypothetical protein
VIKLLNDASSHGIDSLVEGNQSAYPLIAYDYITGRADRNPLFKFSLMTWGI